MVASGLFKIYFFRVNYLDSNGGDASMGPKDTDVNASLGNVNASETRYAHVLTSLMCVRACVRACLCKMFIFG